MVTVRGIYGLWIIGTANSWGIFLTRHRAVVTVMGVCGSTKWHLGKFASECVAPRRYFAGARKYEEECMSSMRQGLASKLLAVLGGAGLAISFCAPRANAQAAPVPPWANANYANRYICNVTSTTSAVPATATRSFFTGIMKLNPNGSGFFQGGTLNVALTPFTGVTPTGNASANFCSYTLDASSIYTVNQDGTGGESLVWDA